MRLISLGLLLAGGAGGCSTVHGVRPVGKGAVRPEFSFGGPITEAFGIPIPLPLTTVGATVGLSDVLDVHAAWHPTPAMMMGIPAFDGGVSYAFRAPEGPRPRLMADLSVVSAFGDAEEGPPEGGLRIWMQPTLTASWDWGQRKRQTSYLGYTGFFQPFPTTAWRGAPVLGQLWGLGPRAVLSTELKWIGPFVETDMLVPHYYAPGSQGAISFQLGFGYTFGGAP